MMFSLKAEYTRWIANSFLIEKGGKNESCTLIKKGNFFAWMCTHSS